MSSRIIKLSMITYAILAAWALWNIAFARGYMDAVNDLGKKGYRFKETAFLFRGQHEE